MLGFGRGHASASASQMQGRLEAAGYEVTISPNDVGKLECAFDFALILLIFFEGRVREQMVL